MGRQRGASGVADVGAPNWGGRRLAEVDAPKRGGGRRLGARPRREGGLQVVRDGRRRKRSDSLQKSLTVDLFGPKKPGHFGAPPPPRRGMGKRLNMVIRALFGAGLPDGAPLATDRCQREAGRQTSG